ncbi:Myb/SANT-like domain [Macleaya cordata]|uniref:Myb/SANT-like domain n=1 Tax=Macleaya cordata TaxID=56857 RepID=A0A200Q9L7_MACCD|nr:Myb/SANT-like domain [Macleaya cordata]
MDSDSPNNQIPTNSQTGRTSWNPPMDRCFIDLMVEKVQEGHLQDGQFSKTAWKHIVDTFNAKFGTNYNRKILRNRQKTLKKNYNAIKNLLEVSGFGWDPVREVVKAEDSVWADYLKVC